MQNNQRLPKNSSNHTPEGQEPWAGISAQTAGSPAALALFHGDPTGPRIPQRTGIPGACASSMGPRGGK